MRQLVDWRAAIIAGIVAAIVFLLVQMVARAALTPGGFWVPLRYIASIVMGESVLPPPASFALAPVLVGLLVHFILSIIYALILAFIIHRWGLAVGIVGGAIFGLGLYAINYYTFSYLFPWFFPIRSWIDIASHVLFGAVAGGVYELLEREVFVPVEE
jgi:hypothetical protein